MLSIIPWVAAHPDGVSTGELCGRFAIDRSELIADLETVSMVGLAPFTPDVLIEVIIDEDHVRINLPHAFERPLRMGPEQALALVVRMQGLLAVPGFDPGGPLSRGLGKLSAATGVELDTTLGIELGRAEPQVLDLLRTALHSKRKIEFDYYTYGRDEHTHRIVDPHSIRSHRGQWYLSGFCNSSNEERTFRIDRISTPVLGGEMSGVITSSPPSPHSAEYTPSEDDPVIELLLTSTATWVLERFPYEKLTRMADGRLSVELRFSSLQRLERLLLRLGSDGAVSDGPVEMRDAARDAARRVLARYGVG